MNSIAISLSENHLRDFTDQLAPFIQPGTIFLLKGDLGAGKTTFSRYLIQSLLKDSSIFVPSPTFTLVQVYEGAVAPIWHCDLYRLGDPQEIQELGLTEAYSQGICLIEWPERLGPFMPSVFIDITFQIINEQERLLTFNIKDQSHGIGKFLSQSVKFSN